MSETLDGLSREADGLRSQMQDIDRLAESAGNRLVTAFASAVHAGSDGARFGESLDALVQAALARKAAAAARERAHSEDP